MRPKLTIDLSLLQENYHFLKRIHRTQALSVVVKADAYGLGMKQVAPALWEAGARHFFVATPFEGQTLRTLLPKAIIYIFSSVCEESFSLYHDFALRPVLNSLSDLTFWAKKRENQEAPPTKDSGNQASGLLPSLSDPILSSALHFDTGMCRLGLEEQDLIPSLPSLIEKAGVGLYISHLACADTPEHPLNQKQRARFQTILQSLPQRPCSLANSSGLFLGEEWHLDLGRPGYALYGGNPIPALPNPLNSVVTLQAPLLQIRTLKKGDPLGYGASYTAQKDQRIGILGLGYADGLSRHLSNQGLVYLNGFSCPVLGRISMDLTAIDLTSLPKSITPYTGQQVEILGPHQNIDTLAQKCGTIGYEILTSLGTRYERCYNYSLKQEQVI